MEETIGFLGLLSMIIGIAMIIMPFAVIAINSKLTRMLANQERLGRDLNAALQVLSDGRYQPQVDTPPVPRHEFASNPGANWGKGREGM